MADFLVDFGNPFLLQHGITVQDLAAWEGGHPPLTLRLVAP